MKIEINSDSCIGCGLCIKACTAKVFRKPEPEGVSNAEGLFDKDATLSSTPLVAKPNACILCGHCVGVCSKGAVWHSDFPPSMVHKIDYAKMPDPDDLLQLIASRRSMRNFKSEAIPAEMLERILEAAHRAPTATNSQKVSFTLITNPEMLYKLSEQTLNTFGKVIRLVENPIVKMFVSMTNPDSLRYIPIFKSMKREFSQGTDRILRGATAVLIISTPKEANFGRDDANLAYQNASLMAEALGVGQFYTGFVLSAFRRDKRKFKELLGIEGEIYAGMALGMPQFKYVNYPDRKPIKLNVID